MYGKGFQSYYRVVALIQRRHLSVVPYNKVKSSAIGIKQTETDTVSRWSPKSSALIQKVKLPESLKNQTSKDKILLKDIIAGCKLSGDYSIAISAAEERLASGVKKRSIITTIIKLYGVTNNIEELIQFLITMEDKVGLKPDPIHYGVATSCCIPRGQVSEAFQIIELMKSNGIKPSTMTYTSLIAAYNISEKYSSSSHRNRVIEVIDSLLSEGDNQLDVAFCNAVITAYGNVGQLRKVYELFERMDLENMKYDIRTYGALMSACAKNNDGDLALQFLTKFKKNRKIKLNIQIYTSCMIAFVRSGQWQAALEQFTEIRNSPRPLPLDAGCYKAALSACAMGNQGRIALELYSEMKNKSFPIDKTTLRFVLQSIGLADWQREQDGSKIREICELAADVGVIPRRETRGCINLITVNSDPKLCIVSLMWMLESFSNIPSDSSLPSDSLSTANYTVIEPGQITREITAQTMAIKSPDIQVIVGNARKVSEQSLIDYLAEALAAIPPVNILRIKKIDSSNGTAFFVTKTSLRAWLRKRAEPIMMNS